MIPHLIGGGWSATQELDKSFWKFQKLYLGVLCLIFKMWYYSSFEKLKPVQEREGRRETHFSLFWKKSPDPSFISTPANLRFKFRPIVHSKTPIG